MGFSGITGPPSLSKLPVNTAQNTIRTADQFTPGVAVTVPSIPFQVGPSLDSYIAGDNYPRTRMSAAGLHAGSGAADPLTVPSLVDHVAISGAVAGTPRVWRHLGVPIGDLAWRNVKHYGAQGNGTTDDRAAIQACINAGAGTVYIPPGTFGIGDTLFWPSNVRIVGAGMYRSTIKALNSFLTANHSMLVNTNNLAWTTSIGIINGGIEDLCFDGNYAGRGGKEAQPNQHNIFLRGSPTSPCLDLYFRRLVLKGAVTMAIALQNVQDTEVSSCHVDDCGRDGISYWGNTIATRTFGNLIENVGDDAIAFNAKDEDASGNELQPECRDNTVANNVIGPGTGGSGIALSGCKRTAVTGNTIFSFTVGIRQIMIKTTPATQADYNTIIGNTIMFAGGDVSQQGGAAGKPTNGVGIMIGTGDVLTFGGSGSHATSHGCVIANNSIWGSRNIGIWLCQSANGGAITDTIVQGNYIQGGGTADANACGILVGGATGTQFNSTNNFVAAASSADISILDNMVTTSARYGIRLHGIARAMVSGNTVYNSGQQTASPGISLNACADAVVSNNRSRNRSGTAQTYGIEMISEGGTTTCTGNVVLNNATGGILRTGPGAGTHYVWENPGSSVSTAAPT